MFGEFEQKLLFVVVVDVSCCLCWREDIFSSLLTSLLDFGLDLLRRNEPNDKFFKLFDRFKEGSSKL